MKWEDVQELLECGALSKDDLSMAIENVGVSVEDDQITFDKFFDLLQVGWWLVIQCPYVWPFA